MKYSELKENLMELFDQENLEALPEEWGFYNETDREIKRVGYATSLTREVIDKAGQAGIDLLLTHHGAWDFVYGLKESCFRMLEERNIIHAFFHAPLDDADFGTSASLAQALGMVKCTKVMPYAEIYYAGVIGRIPPLSFQDFAEKLKYVLQEEVRCFQNNSGPVQKIAVAAGGGNMTGEMRVAAEAGCDTYVTGEYVLYSQQYAQLMGMNLLVGSHTNTEILGVASMAGKLVRSVDIQLIRIEEPNY